MDVRRALVGLLAAAALVLVAGLVARASSGTAAPAVHVEVLSHVGDASDRDGDHDPSFPLHVLGACVAVLVAVVVLLRRILAVWRTHTAVTSLPLFAVSMPSPVGSSRASPSQYQLCVQLC